MNSAIIHYSIAPSQGSVKGAGIRRTFKNVATLLAAFAMITITLLVQSCSSDAQAGPNGGDVIPMGDGQTSAEVMSNADSGEVMVHTWGKDLKTAHPIEAKALTMGSGANQIQLEPHPLPGDPAGKCSRFYGRAEWLRGGGARKGWLNHSNSEAGRMHFDWNRGWKAGASHSGMWTGMGGHGPGMGQGGTGQGGHGGMRK